VRTLLDQPCVGCQRRQPRGLTCARCRPRIPLTGIRSIGRYGTPWVRRSVHWLKFRGVEELVSIVAPYLVAELTAVAPLEQLQQKAVLLPVPLHRRRLRQRGFNQSALLAQEIGNLSAIPSHDVLCRRRSTPSQTQLTDDLRAENMTGAFELDYALEPNRSIVILIDDVATSGATLVACAQTLRSLTSVRQVWGLTIARG